MTELLAPAGNLEKLKVAVLYGADAVYIGGQNFGLRTASDNFSNEEIDEGVKFAHRKDAKVYVVLNSFLHDKEIEELPPFIKYLESIKVDAVIVSDLGVVEVVKIHSDLKIHLSTQASCLNSDAALFWKNLGISRIILGREVSIDEAYEIKQKSGIEVEMFIHGSMCISYSGNCVISNFTSGRDSNRGGCAQSCRFEYKLESNGKESNCFFMSAKDLKGVKYLEKFKLKGIDSLKIEGRMRSHHYVGTVVKAYSDVLDYYQKTGTICDKVLEVANFELSKVAHRDYSDGNLVKPAGKDSIYFERENVEQDYEMAGFIQEVHEEQFVVLEVRRAFNLNNILELLPFGDDVVSFKASWITDILGNSIERTRPGTLVKLPFLKGAEKWNLVRLKVKESGD